MDRAIKYIRMERPTAADERAVGDTGTPLDQHACEGSMEPISVSVHEFAYDQVDAVGLGGAEFTLGRWLCSCGQFGQWEPQEETAARYFWLQHVEVHP